MFFETDIWRHTYAVHHHHHHKHDFHYYLKTIQLSFIEAIKKNMWHQLMQCDIYKNKKCSSTTILIIMDQNELYIYFL